MNDNRVELPFRIDDMQVDEIEEVMAIETRSFSSPWSTRAYKYELTGNSFSHFIVLRQSHAVPQHTNGYAGAFRKLLLASTRPVRYPVLGYAGLWLLADEAHISTIAVMPEWRGQGLGEFLLIGLLERAAVIQAEIATLEVRVSNQVAQNLYRKYQFQTVGVRRGYYHDNMEDALVMSTPSLRSPAFGEILRQNTAALFRILTEDGRVPRQDKATSQMG